MLELLLGQIPEAIYFSLFMIYAKKIDSKRILFTLMMIAEYLILKSIISFDIWFQISYTFITYILLKFLYKEKAQITDIFTFTIASILLILISAVPYFIIWFTVNNFAIYVIVSRVLLFSTLFVLRKHLYKIQLVYKKYWNRNDKVKKVMKSATFRAVNVVVFNLIFYIIHLGMIFIKLQIGGE